MISHAPDSERNVVGSFLIEREAIESCINFLEPQHFYDQINALLCLTAYELYRAKKIVDIVSVMEELRGGDLEQHVKPEYLTQCVDSVTTTSHVQHHAENVIEKWYERQIMNACTRLSEQQDQDTLSEVGALFQKKDALRGQEAFTYKNGLFDLLDHIQKSAQTDLFKTPFNSLNSVWFGVKKEELITLAAAPGMGKSLMTLNLMSFYAKQDIPCLYFGTEMSRYELAQRHLSILSGIPAFKMRTGKMDMEDISLAHSAIRDRMSVMPITINDNPRPSPEDIDRAIVQSGATHIFVDQLSRISHGRGEQLRIRVAETMRTFKTIARKRRVVLWNVVQLGRDTYGNEERMPRLSDLSECKEIEQESDLVGLMWAPNAKNQNPAAEFKNIEFIPAKARAGYSGVTINLTLSRKTLRIEEADNVYA